MNWAIHAGSNLVEDNSINVKLKREDEKKYQAFHAANESRESRAAKNADNTCTGTYRTAFASVERSVRHSSRELLTVR